MTVPAPADQTATCGRKAGRPRSQAIDDAVIAATLDILLEAGVSGLSIDAVAAHAGVARTTVYRRWATMDLLIVDAVATLYAPVEPLVGASLRDDLLAFVGATRATFEGSIAGQLIPRLLVDDLEPSCIEGIKERVIAPRRQVLLARLARAQEDGEIASGTDLDVVADLIVGPTIWRFMTRRLYGPVDADYSGHLIDIVLQGAGSSDADRVNRQ